MFSFFSFSDESTKGCNSYFANECSRREEVFLTTWSFNVNEIRTKCPINCDKIYKFCTRKHDDINTLIKAFRERANYLIQNVDHRNLIRYIDVSCTESNGMLTIHLLQDYIECAKSVRELSNNGILPDLPPIAEWLLKVIAYLERMNPKIDHGFINDGSIFVDNLGVYRFADFNLVPYLMFLKDTKRFSGTSDLKALGSFIHHENITVQQCSEDFIAKCYSDEKCCFQELLAHAFLSNVHIGEATSTYNGPLLNQFRNIEVLGKGIGTCVIQVEQPANGEFFALKIIKIPIASKGNYTKIRREIDLIPEISHKNVVRYLANWEQTIDMNELRISFEEDEYAYSSASEEQTIDVIELGNSSSKEESECSSSCSAAVSIQ